MKNCLMCQKPAVETEDGLMLCGECEALRQENLTKIQEEKEMEKSNVVDVDFTEVKEDVNVEAEAVQEEQGEPVKAALVLGITESGKIIFNIDGTNPDYVSLLGLIEHGKRKVNQIIDQREYEVAMAQMQAAKEAEAEAVTE